MAKLKEVAKFGGVDELGKATVNDFEHDVASIETQSKTKLEDDKGIGNAVIIRCFTFGANPIAFKDKQPTKQELFNYHWKGIELSLWKDGMVIYPAVEPRLVLNKKKTHYQIFVAATPSHRSVVLDTPQTLSKLVNG